MRARGRDWVFAALLVALYTVLLGYLAVRRRQAMFHFDEDLAIYDQIVWNTAHGRPFASTLIQHADNMLGDHFSPIVALFAPLYWLWSSPNVLLLGQTLFLGAAALPLYALARQRLGARAGLALSAAYLVFPAVTFVNLFQFHEIALIVLPLSLALLTIERGWRGWFLAAALLTLTVKEEAAIVVVCLGLLWWLRRRDWRMALGTIVLGVAVGLATMGLILPGFSTAGGGYYYVRRYAYLGATPLEMAVNAVTSPGLLVSHLATLDRLRFLAQLFLPLALLPLVGWEYLVAALPVFGYLLLAESPDQYAIDRHYLAPLLPFVFFGAAVGVRRLGARSAGLALAASLAGAYLIGPTPLARGYDPVPDAITAHTGQLRRLVAQVPTEAPVAASRNLLSWFSRRERVYRFPELSDAQYVALDFRELRHPAAFGLDGGAFGRLVESPNYRLADAADGAVLFERGDPGFWPWPAGPATRFGDEVELIHYRIEPRPDGRSIQLLLVWLALARPRSQYTVFVHALDESGERIAQADGPPLDGLLPTDTWAIGHVVPDRHTVRLDRRLADVKRVRIGLYDPRDGWRLPISPRGPHGEPDWIDLDVPSNG